MTIAPETVPLSTKMRALADSAAIAPDRSSELRAKADELDKATHGYWAEPPTVSVAQFVGAWARARKLWCDCTGERLV